MAGFPNDRIKYFVNLAQKGLGVFLSNWAVLPLHFVTGVLVVRTLGAEGKGILVIFTTGLTLLSAIGQCGLPNAATYLLRQGVANDRALLLHYGLLLLVFTALVAAALLGAQDWFWRVGFGDAPAQPVLLRLALVCLPLMMATQFLAVLVLAKGDARGYARQTMGLGVLNMVFTLLLVVWLKAGVVGGMSALALAQLINLGFASRRIWQRTVGQEACLSWRVLGRMLQFGFQNYFVSLGSLVFKRVDTFLIQAFLGTAAVGLYSVARVPFDTLLTVPRAVSGLVAGEASGRDPVAAGALVAKVTRNVLWIMLAAVLPLAAAAPGVVPLVYGADFAQSVPALLVLLAAAVLFGGSISLQTYFVGVGRPYLNSRFTLLAGVANVALSVGLIPRLGITGNALACLAATLLLYLLQVAAFLRLSGGRWLDVCRLETADLRHLFHQIRHRSGRSRQAA